MIWLIQQLAAPLAATLLFAAVAAWGWHALAHARREAELDEERKRLLRDILKLTSEEPAPPPMDPGPAIELDALRRRAELVASRVKELEKSLEDTRGEANDAAARAARAERLLEENDADAAELERLREEVGALRLQQAAAIDVEAEPAPSDEEAAEAQGWRLRYFEQRVRYLEGLQREAPAEAPAPAPLAGLAPYEIKRLEWRARTAEARARHLEEAARVTRAKLAVPAERAPEDDIARWRMRYLERRAAYLASERLAQAPPAALPAPPAPDPDAEKFKWRARFLESRVRHLDRLLAEAQAALAAPKPEPVMTAPQPAALEEVEEEAPAPAPAAPLVAPGAERRPPSLPAARDGAPDDLTLIEGVSPMQQSTLNSLGVYHFDQIAAWRPEHVAWVDQYLRLRGRILAEQWVEQADTLAREGPLAFKRAFEEEDA